MSMDMQDEMKEILEEFFTEADESLDQLEQDLIQLETLSEDGETDSETVDRLFRVLHTLKGGAGFLSLEYMAKLAHAGENLLDEVRGGKVAISKTVMDNLLQTNDNLKELLNLHRVGDDGSSVDNTALIAELNRLAEGGASEEKAEASIAEPEAPISDAPAVEVNQELLAEVQSDSSLGAVEEAPAVEVNQELLAEVQADASLGAKEAVPAVEVNQDLLAEVQSDSSLGAVDAAPSVDVNQELLAEVQSDESLGAKPDAEKKDAAPVATTEVADRQIDQGVVKRGEKLEERRKPKAPDRRGVSDERRKVARRAADPMQETIRVETGRLDKVMNLVGELVLARNSLIRQLGLPEVKSKLEGLEANALINGNIEQLSRVTQDLQMSVLSTRMQPIKKVFDKIPRQVRELKTQLKKEVNLVIEGEMTEVDKSLVEDLADPMVHMIRNALDHGIETPEERLEMGKSSEGTLTVRAFYEGNNVVIEVKEDGKGIDPMKIREIAVSKGIVTENAANAMSDKEAIRLIMAAGFSTAEVISDVSGRGVGMDVVNSKIADMQGTVDIKSELGMGTSFSIYLPLTLAIVQALVVASNKEGFAVPIGDISEVIKFTPQDIHKMNDQDVIELRGEALPLFYLSRLTKKGFVAPVVLPKEVEQAQPVEEPQPVDPENPTMEELEAIAAYNAEVTKIRAPKESSPRGFVVVVRDGTSAMGLVVDQLIGQEEAVVKPVTDMFDYNKAISGATITGDGTVHMILDVPFMIKQLGQA